MGLALEGLDRPALRESIPLVCKVLVAAFTGGALGQNGYCCDMTHCVDMEARRRRAVKTKRQVAISKNVRALFLQAIYAT